MRRTIFLLAFLIIWSKSIIGQHSLSIQGGWTFSSLYKVASPEVWEASSYYADLFELAPIHLPYLGLRYNYRLQDSNWRVSTGASVLCLGTRDFFWKGTEWAFMYLTLPLVAGYQHQLSGQSSIIVEGGLEGGVSIDNVGSFVILGRPETRPYIGLILGVEGNYKRLNFGIRGHLGLNNFHKEEFVNAEGDLYFRHVGGTVYLGYTFWDSAKAKKRKAERKKKKS